MWNLHSIVLSLILFSVCFCFDRFYCGINFVWQGVAGKDNRGQDPLHTVWVTISNPFDAEKTSWNHHDKILPISHEGSMSFVLPFYQTYDNWPPAVCWPITHVWCNQSSVNHIYKTIIANLSPTCCSEYDADERCVPPPVLKCARNKDWCDDTNIQIRQRKLFCCLTTVNRSIFWCDQSSATGVTPVASYEAMANVIFYEVTELQNVLSTF